MLPRLYDPDEGSVWIDGADVSGVSGTSSGGTPTAVGIKQNGGTNWEDGFLRIRSVSTAL